MREQHGLTLPESLVQGWSQLCFRKFLILGQRRRPALGEAWSGVSQP